MLLQLPYTVTVKAHYGTTTPTPPADLDYFDSSGLRPQTPVFSARSQLARSLILWLLTQPHLLALSPLRSLFPSSPSSFFLLILRLLTQPHLLAPSPLRRLHILWLLTQPHLLAPSPLRSLFPSRPFSFFLLSTFPLPTSGRPSMASERMPLSCKPARRLWTTMIHG
jgi:hypothetical protein